MGWDPHAPASGFAQRSCALLASKRRDRQVGSPAISAALSTSFHRFRHSGMGTTRSPWAIRLHGSAWSVARCGRLPRVLQSTLGSCFSLLGNLFNLFQLLPPGCRCEYLPVPIEIPKNKNPVFHLFAGHNGQRVRAKINIILFYA